MACQHILMIGWSARIGILLTHVSLLAWSASLHSPTLNEPAILAAGLSHWQFGRFELYRGNPPLVRMVASLPLLASEANTDWGAFYEGPGACPEFQIGADFVAANGEKSARLTTFARWACIPFSVLGAVVCYAWARELYGLGAGLLAAAFWCFSPTILAHASLVTADVPCAALATLASYCFWHFINRPSWGSAAASGVALGIAELTKMTLVAFYPLWAALWFTQRWWAKAPPTFGRKHVGVMLGLLFAVSLYVVNLGYCFEGSFTRLDNFQFVSTMFVGNSEAGNGNRFVESPLACLPIPLPKNYVLGADLQRWAFEHTETPSYLRGTFQMTGWWYYYLYGLLIKVPLGTWGLLLVTTALKFAGVLPRPRRGAEFVLLAPAAVLLAFVSSQSSYSQHWRYVIPFFPFVFIWLSQLACIVRLRLVKTTVGCAVLLTWSLASSFACYPHSLSYFNELAGGPEGGHNHLLGSNVDWGQDLLYLKLWLEQHPSARPVYLSCIAFYDPKHLGIEGVDALEQCRTRVGSSAPLLPGWYAISVNQLRWWEHLINSNSGQAQVGCALYELLKMRPIAKVGYSILIFRIPAEDAALPRADLLEHQDGHLLYFRPSTSVSS